MIRAGARPDFIAYERATGYVVGPDFTAVCEEKDGVLRALVGFDHWTPATCQAHVLITDMAALVGNTFLREVFDYAFRQAGKKIVYAITPADHDASLKFSDWLGFKEIGRLKDGWDIGTDMIVKEMRPEGCKWIKGNPHE